MRDGFFPESTTLSTRKDDHLSLPKCESCGFYKTCKSPKMPLYGKGKKKILVVGEAPGATEDDKNKPFVGKTGQRLRDELDKLGIDLKEDCWVTNALICRPPDNDIGKNPEVKIGYCRPNLIQNVMLTKPRVIILLGHSAVASLIKWLWKDKVGPLERWLGWTIPSQQLNAWVCPTFHPSYVERADEQMVDFYFREHLKTAIEKADARPWKEVPNYEGMIDVIMDDEEAAERIYEVIKLNVPTSGDYEGNGLKPEYEGFKILSCAIHAMGQKRAFSFPFQGKAIDVLGEFWQSRVPKMASNMKMEDRVSKWYYGKWVRNWYLDIMLMAHFLDCRQGITGLKFQCFQRLGFGSYNDHIEPLLRSVAGRRLNDAEFRVSQRQLLLYGGIDALCTTLVAENQLQEIKQR